MAVFTDNGKSSKPIARNNVLFTQTGLEPVKMFSSIFAIRPESPWAALTFIDAVVVTREIDTVRGLLSMFSLAPEMAQEIFNNKEKCEEFQQKLDTMKANNANKQEMQFLITFMSFDSSGRLRKCSLMEKDLAPKPNKGARQKRLKRAPRATNRQSTRTVSNSPINAER
jgi:hypothetical protein